MAFSKGVAFYRAHSKLRQCLCLAWRWFWGYSQSPAAALCCVHVSAHAVSELHVLLPS